MPGVGRVRFFGIDTPERGEACFSEAAAATERLVGATCAWRTAQGCLIASTYVYDASGNSIDVQLVAGGYARAWTQDGQHLDVLVGLERIAREHGAGCLWE